MDLVENDRAAEAPCLAMWDSRTSSLFAFLLEAKGTSHPSSSREVDLIVHQPFTTISKMVFNIGRLDTSAEVWADDFIRKIFEKF